MYNIDFYRTEQGFSDIENFLDDLEKQAIIVCCFFTSKTTLLFFFIIFGKRHRKHLNGKLKKQRTKQKNGYQERGNQNG